MDSLLPTLATHFLPAQLGRILFSTDLRVFCYHGVVERIVAPRLERNLHLLSDFREHVTFLNKVRVLSLAELPDIASGVCRRWGGAVITFDDGYRNNLAAAEVLSDLGLPWSVFVTTGALGLGRSLWTVELSLLLLHGEAARIEALGQMWALGSRDERESCFQAIRYPMKAMPMAQRIETLECVRQQFPAGEKQRLLQVFPSLQMLGWEELRQLANAGVEVGSHGVTHEIHHDAQPAAVRRVELVDSKAAIEAQLGRPCRFFAFPNGDAAAASAQEVEAAGYELGFTLQPGFVTPDSNRFLLPRLLPPGSVKRFVQEFRRPSAAD